MRYLNILIGGVALLGTATGTLAEVPGHAAFTPEPQFIQRDATLQATFDKLRLTTVLVAGGPPYPGSTFTVLRDEPGAFGKTRHKVMAVSGPQAHAGFNLAPGRYRIQVRNGAVSTEQLVDVPVSGVLEQRIVLDAGELELSSLMYAGGEAAEQTWFRVFREERDSWGKIGRVQVAGNGYASRASFLLPAGDYLAEAVFGNTRREQVLKVAAGARIAHEFVLDAGLLELNVVLSGDGEPADGARVAVLRRQEKASGGEHWTEFTHAEDAPAITFVLPAGEYLARASLGHSEVARAITVVAGESRAVELPLDAGSVTLFATLPDSDETLLDSRFWLHDDSRPNEPARIRAGSWQGPQAKATFMVPAGEYRAVVKSGEAVGSTMIEVVAGTQQIVSVPIDGARVSLALETPGETGPQPHTWFSVYRVKTTADGPRQRRRVFHDGYYPEVTLVLPPGHYLAFGRSHGLRGEAAFEVTGGGRQSVALTATTRMAGTTGQARAYPAAGR